MDISQLAIIQKYLEIHETEGPLAAQKWAAEQTAILEESESSDKKPHLRIVN